MHVPAAIITQPRPAAATQQAPRVLPPVEGVASYPRGAAAPVAWQGERPVPNTLPMPAVLAMPGWRALVQWPDPDRAAPAIKPPAAARPPAPAHAPVTPPPAAPPSAASSSPLSDPAFLEFTRRPTTRFARAAPPAGPEPGVDVDAAPPAPARTSAHVMPAVQVDAASTPETRPPPSPVVVAPPAPPPPRTPTGSAFAYVATTSVTDELPEPRPAPPPAPAARTPTGSAFTYVATARTDELPAPRAGSPPAPPPARTTTGSAFTYAATAPCADELPAPRSPAPPADPAWLADPECRPVFAADGAPDALARLDSRERYNLQRLTGAVPLRDIGTLALGMGAEDFVALVRRAARAGLVKG